ncbi:uncharacterized protein LOC117188832 [Drosophila miranda]|uniref:uncharacterized protein LOC117188832 n=1 Tax=Drosophila miranda TaxID=7229 RepID=UPI00143F6EC7|nr:uncharacterized protein LOC117188832 [Drosophila miranda]
MKQVHEKTKKLLFAGAVAAAANMAEWKNSINSDYVQMSEKFVRSSSVASSLAQDKLNALGAKLTAFLIDPNNIIKGDSLANKFIKEIREFVNASNAELDRRQIAQGMAVGSQNIQQ